MENLQQLDATELIFKNKKRNMENLSAADLRIGNLVHNINEVIKIECIDPGNNEVNYEIPFNIIFGIPLTEEWILNLGFTKSLIFNSYYINSDIEINIFDNIFWYDTKNDSIEIKTVHDLQNLFYAITKTELTYDIHS